MKIEFLVQNPNSPIADTLGYLFEKRLIGGDYDNTLVSVAYMTVAGVRTLLAAFPSELPRQSKWLIGLDDLVTQPGALDVVLKLPKSEVRVISYSSQGFRFHPKVYIFQKKSVSKNGITILGSANLTAHGLRGNGEANAVFQINGATDSEQILNLWEALWSQGHKPTQKELSAYKKQYEKAQNSKPKKKVVSRRTSAGLVILASDDAELDPSVAKTCWIECGYITAMGRELELKAEQGIFFGLNPLGGDPKNFDFRVSSGKILSLRMKFQGNHMWRLQLTNDVPEVAVGLRPTNPDRSLGRSPYVAVIDRTDKSNLYELRFVNLNSQGFKRIVKKSIEMGTYGKTTARQYGWC